MNTIETLDGAKTAPLRSNLVLLLALLIGLGATPRATASLDTLYYIPMGDQEPTANYGLPIDPTAVLGTLPPFKLVPHGKVLYEHPSPSANQHLASQTSIFFAEEGGYLDAPAEMLMPTNHFGMELWVRPEALPTGFSIIAYAGDTTKDGYGFYQSGNEYGVSLGAIGRINGIKANVGQWIHLAYVQEDNHGVFYSNGIPAVQAVLQPKPPTAAGFRIAARPQPPAAEYFYGEVDDVRIFSFEPGGFTDQDLLINSFLRPESPVDVTGTTATLRAWLVARTELTSIWFEYGQEGGEWQSTTPVFAQGSKDHQAFSATIENLDPARIYHCRAVSSNSVGILRGVSLPFKTSPWVVNLNNDGPGSLRDVIAHSDHGDTVLIATTGTIGLKESGIVIDKALTIIPLKAGAGVTLDGGGKVRPLDIGHKATVSWDGLRIKNGKAPDGPLLSNMIPSPDGENGGGILNHGILRLENGIIENCQTGQGGTRINGGLFTAGGNGGHGGGIYNDGSLALSHCLIRGNTTGHGGTGTEGQILFPGGTGGNGGSGAGVYSTSECYILDSSIVENIAGNGGQGGTRGINQIQKPGEGGQGGSGGGVYCSQLCVLFSTTLSENTTGRAGTRGESTEIDPNSTGQGGAICQTGAGNSILNLRVYSCTVASNSAPSSLACSGIYSRTSGTSPQYPILYSSIIAWNSSGSTNDPDPDLQGHFSSYSQNLITIVGAGATIDFDSNNPWDSFDTTGWNGFPVSISLSALLPYSDTAWIHIPDPEAPAIDHGASLSEIEFTLGQLEKDMPFQFVELLDPTHDQVGSARQIGNRPDIGAIEYDASLLQPLTATLGAEIRTAMTPKTTVVDVEFKGVFQGGGYNFTAYFEMGRTSHNMQKVFVNSPDIRPGVRLLRATASNISAGSRYVYRLVVETPFAKQFGALVDFSVPAPTKLGDGDADGQVSAQELAEVLHNYATQPDWLRLTQMGSLGQPLISFNLGTTNPSPFLVETSEDLVTWKRIGPAIPRYEIMDTNGPTNKRFYRLAVP